MNRLQAPFTRYAGFAPLSKNDPMQFDPLA
jgi:hypothetical protein